MYSSQDATLAARMETQFGMADTGLDESRMVRTLRSSQLVAYGPCKVSGI
jgi:hypothetical protein